METKKSSNHNCICDVATITDQSGYCSKCKGLIQTKLSRDGKIMMLSKSDWELYRENSRLR